MGKVTARRKELNDRLRLLLPFTDTADEDHSAWVDPAQLLRFLADNVYKDAKRLEISVEFDGRSLYKYCRTRQAEEEEEFEGQRGSDLGVFLQVRRHSCSTR